MRALPDALQAWRRLPGPARRDLCRCRAGGEVPAPRPATPHVVLFPAGIRGNYVFTGCGETADPATLPGPPRRFQDGAIRTTRHGDNSAPRIAWLGDGRPSLDGRVRGPEDRRAGRGQGLGDR